MNNGNSGPFRVPRPTERRSAPRPAESRTVEPVTREEPVAPRASTRRQPEPKQSPLKWIIALTVSAVIIVILGVFLLLKPSGSGAVAIDSGKYQAVFFTNGQVYFGKLSSANDKYFSLKEVFYIQTPASGSSELQQTGDNQSGDVQLIKLGGELHGPEDEMIISKDQVLFYENLKPDGKVSQSIKEYKK